MNQIECVTCGYSYKVPNKTILTNCRRCKATIINPICGECLHSRQCHTTENGHLMACASCGKLCDVEEFNKDHNATDIGKIFEIQAHREHSKYSPKEFGRDLVWQKE